MLVNLKQHLKKLIDVDLIQLAEIMGYFRTKTHLILQRIPPHSIASFLSFTPEYLSDPINNKSAECAVKISGN